MGKKRPAGFTDFRKLLEDKIDRRGFDRHAEPSPYASNHLGLPGGQRCVCRKALLARHVRGAADRRRREEVQPHRSARDEQQVGIAREAIQKMHDGLIGDVYMARGLCFKWRDTIGRKPVEPVPPGVHYDLWLGPAPEHAVHAQPLPLQLALVLGLRQRRPWQPGHPSVGRGALGPRRQVSDQGQRHRRPHDVR